MAEEENKTEEAPAKKKLPMKMIIILAVVMVVEGAIFGAGYFIFGDKPPAVQAEGLKANDKAAEFEPVEVLLIGDKFQNTRQGAQAYLYDATIYVVVQRRHQEHIEAQIEANMARISEEITEVFSRAEPAQLNEPDRLTLKRQILKRCQDRFGRVYEDFPRVGDNKGEDAKKKDYGQNAEDYYVRDVVISNWKRFSTDL